MQSAAAPDDVPPAAKQNLSSVWIERLVLTGFRNYSAATIEAQPGVVVLTGHNGAGKTNLLEAISLLTSGNGLRRVAFDALGSSGGAGDWTIAARVHTVDGARDIGTGLRRANSAGGRSGRIVRVDGVTQSGSGAFAEVLDMVWLTPAMDGLFTGAAGERRRFLDRLIQCFDAGYRTRVNHFERAMSQRNRLLSDGVRDPSRLAGLEMIMAETGVAMAAARAEAVAQLSATIEGRRDREPNSLFPWSRLALDGRLEAELAARPAIEVEDVYLGLLAAGRDRDRAAGRALEGPHRSDLLVWHGPKAAPAAQCSTGEQKALLVGLVLAHAELVAQRREGATPIVLLDEIAAHLDAGRRQALFNEIHERRAQVWMTGTDVDDFAALENRALFLMIQDGCVTRAR